MWKVGRGLTATPTVVSGRPHVAGCSRGGGARPRGVWGSTGDSSNCRIGTVARCPDVMVTRCESRMELAATMDSGLNCRIGAAVHYRERTRDEVRVQGMEPVARMGGGSDCLVGEPACRPSSCATRREARADGADGEKSC